MSRNGGGAQRTTNTGVRRLTVRRAGGPPENFPVTATSKHDTSQIFYTPCPELRIPRPPPHSSPDKLALCQTSSNISLTSSSNTSLPATRNVTISRLIVDGGARCDYHEFILHGKLAKRKWFQPGCNNKTPQSCLSSILFIGSDEVWQMLALQQFTRVHIHNTARISRNTGKHIVEFKSRIAVAFSDAMGGEMAIIQTFRRSLAPSTSSYVTLGDSIFSNNIQVRGPGRATCLLVQVTAGLATPKAYTTCKRSRIWSCPGPACRVV
jgi:hypothetical protein